LVAALSRWNDLDLYHYHIIYDTVSLTGVSYTASLLSSWISKEAKKETSSAKMSTIKRLVTSSISMLVSWPFFIAIFVVLYLIFVILFGITLSKWNYDEPGRCYNTHLIAMSSSSHPSVDRIYLGISCVYTLSSFYIVFFFSRAFKSHLASTNPADAALDNKREQPSAEAMAKEARRKKVTETEAYPSPGTMLKVLRSGDKRSINHFLLGQMRFSVVFIALLQYPLHLYMAVAIRVSNQPYLEGESENTWAFGQIVALVLLVPVIKECAEGYIEYTKEKEKGPEARMEDVEEAAAVSETK
jgi:hypothetical protein